MSRGLGRLQRQVLEVVVAGPARETSPYSRLVLPTPLAEPAPAVEPGRWTVDEGRPVYIADAVHRVPADAIGFPEVLLRLGYLAGPPGAIGYRLDALADAAERTSSVHRALRSLWERGLVAPVFLHTMPSTGRSRVVSPAREASPGDPPPTLLMKLIRPNRFHWLATSLGRRELRAQALESGLDDD